MADIFSSQPFRRSGSPGAEAARPPPSLPGASLSPSLRSDRTAAHLASLIEAQIIPRLMLAHARGEASAPSEPGVVGRRTLDAFTRMALASEAPVLAAYIDTLMQGGLTLEAVYLELLAPAARRLGDDWNEDLISFTDVTIGLSRLQQVVRALGRSLPAPELGDRARSACFVPSPGEQHTFGLVIVEDCFRRAGWRTWLDTGATAEAACEAVSLEWFDVLGLSATSTAPAAPIEAVITQVRAASLNPDLYVFVGGGLFSDDPAMTGRVGADACAGTALDALSLADEAVKPRAFA